MVRLLIKFLIVATVIFPFLGGRITTATRAQQTQIFSGRRTSHQNQQQSQDDKTVASLMAEVDRQISLSNYYGVFDWLEAQVKNDRSVTLHGQVVRSVTKFDAEIRVRLIEGVGQVNSDIEVLPLSVSDERLRWALYHSLFNMHSPLFRYSIQPIPSIHIIVKAGTATLKGVVTNETDCSLAYMLARRVPGLFDVTCELQVDKSGSSGWRQREHLICVTRESYTQPTSGINEIIFIGDDLCFTVPENVT